MKRCILFLIVLCGMVLGADAQKITVPVVNHNDGTKTVLKGDVSYSFGYGKNIPVALTKYELMQSITASTATNRSVYPDDYYSATIDSISALVLRGSSSTRNWTTTFSLGFLSGRYNVYIEAVTPSSLMTADYDRPVPFTATINYYKDGTKQSLTTTTLKTDTSVTKDYIKVLENVDLPEQTKFNSGEEVTLTLTTVYNSKRTQGCTTTLYLSRIVLEPVDSVGNPATPSNPALIVSDGKRIPCSKIENITYHEASLQMDSVVVKDPIDIRLYGRVKNYKAFRDYDARYGLNLGIINYINGIKTPVSLPSTHSAFLNDTTGNDAVFCVSMPCMDYSKYRPSLYFTANGDSVVSNSLYIKQPAATALPEKYIKVIKAEQIPGTYKIEVTIDARGLEEILAKTQDTWNKYTIVERTEEPGIYKHMIYTFGLDWESGNHELPSICYYISNESTNTEKLYNLTSDIIIPYTKPDPKTDMLPDKLSKDTVITLFSKALEVTGLDNMLNDYMDKSYSIGKDSVNGNIPAVYYAGHNHSQSDDNSLRYPEKRYYKFTAFAETDDVYQSNGIFNIEDLKAYAKNIYDQTYPDDAGKYDDDPTNSRNPLNRFMRYHLMDRAGTYSDWAPSGQIYSSCWKPEVADAEDYFPSMCQGQILRFCRLSNGRLYINRRGRGNTVRPGCGGVRVYTNEEAATINPDPNISQTSALNGVYFYINDILAYSPTVKDCVLNCRMRIDATTLSPDFMNQGARGNYGQEILCMFKNDYVKNFKLSENTSIGVHNDNMWWSSYLGNAICIKGQFDFSVKLPTPPAGIYEIRLGYVSRTNGSIIQTYLNDQPLGLPVDMTIGAWDSSVGWEDDWTPESTGYSETECLQHNIAIDQSMRNNGYMKAMDSYRKGTGATSFRVDNPESLRRILVSDVYLDGGEKWLRFKKLDDSDTEFSFDYIEIVPSAVYNNPDGEDQH